MVLLEPAFPGTVQIPGRTQLLMDATWKQPLWLVDEKSLERSVWSMTTGLICHFGPITDASMKSLKFQMHDVEDDHPWGPLPAWWKTAKMKIVAELIVLCISLLTCNHRIEEVFQLLNDFTVMIWIWQWYRRRTPKQIQKGPFEVLTRVIMLLKRILKLRLQIEAGCKQVGHAFRMLKYFPKELQMLIGKSSTSVQTVSSVCLFLRLRAQHTNLNTWELSRKIREPESQPKGLLYLLVNSVAEYVGSSSFARRGRGGNMCRFQEHIQDVWHKPPCRHQKTMCGSSGISFLCQKSRGTS